MGAAGTSYARETDSMRSDRTVVYCLDRYNDDIVHDLCVTIRSAGAGGPPQVLICNEDENEEERQ